VGALVSLVDTIKDLSGLGFIPVSRRHAPLIAVLGDSRAAQIHADTTRLNITNSNIFSWANALSGHRVTIGYPGGISGDRSDQMLARVAGAILTNSGTAYIHIGVNDIAQAFSGFVSTAGPMAGQTINLTNAALHVFANIVFAYSRLVRAGFTRVIIVLEPGATNCNAQQVGQVHELNQRLRDWAETAYAVTLFDLPFYVWNPTSSGSVIGFKTGYRRYLSGVADNDPTHLSSAGGYAGGVPLAALFTQLYPHNPRELRSINEIASGNSNINQIANPMFVTGTGGSAGTGTSAGGPGTAGIPGLFGTNRDSVAGANSGTQTALISTGTPADGSPGKEAILACTFGAAWDAVRIGQDWTLANWNIGDIIQGGCEVSIDDCTGLAGVFMYLQVAGNGGSTAMTTMDMLPSDQTQFTTGPLKMSLLTEKMTIPASIGTKAWITQRLIVVGSGAGTPVVRVRRFQGKRRFS
jgi:hypothetical protein